MTSPEQHRYPEFGLDLNALPEDVRAEIAYASNNSPETTKSFDRLMQPELPEHDDWSVTITPGKNPSDGTIHIPDNEASNGLQIVASTLQLERNDQEDALGIVRRGPWMFLMIADGAKDQGSKKEQGTGGKLVIESGEKILKEAPQIVFEQVNRAEQAQALDALHQQIISTTQQAMKKAGMEYRVGLTTFTLVAINTEEGYARHYNIGDTDGWLQQPHPQNADQLIVQEFIEPQDQGSLSVREAKASGHYMSPDYNGVLMIRSQLKGACLYSNHTPTTQIATMELGPEGTIALRTDGCNDNMLGDAFENEQGQKTTGHKFPATTMTGLMDPRLGSLTDRARTAMGVVEACQREKRHDKIARIGHKQTNKIDNATQMLAEWSESPQRQFEVFVARAMNGYITGSYPNVQEAFNANRNRVNGVGEFVKANPSQATEILNDHALRVMDRLSSKQQLRLPVMLRIIEFVYRMFEGGETVNSEILRAPELKPVVEYVDQCLQKQLRSNREWAQTDSAKAWRAFIPRFESKELVIALKQAYKTWTTSQLRTCPQDVAPESTTDPALQRFGLDTLADNPNPLTAANVATFITELLGGAAKFHHVEGFDELKTALKKHLKPAPTTLIDAPTPDSIAQERLRHYLTPRHVPGDMDKAREQLRYIARKPTPETDWAFSDGYLEVVLDAEDRKSKNWRYEILATMKNQGNEGVLHLKPELCEGFEIILTCQKGERENQEDSVGMARVGDMLYIVKGDGNGSDLKNEGGVASSMAVEMMIQNLLEGRTIAEGFEWIESEICDRRNTPEYRNGGTTFTVTAINLMNGQISTHNVGDHEGWLFQADQNPQEIVHPESEGQKVMEEKGFNLDDQRVLNVSHIVYRCIAGDAEHNNFVPTVQTAHCPVGADIAAYTDGIGDVVKPHSQTPLNDADSFPFVTPEHLLAQETPLKGAAKQLCALAEAREAESLAGNARGAKLGYLETTKIDNRTLVLIRRHPRPIPVEQEAALWGAAPAPSVDEPRSDKPADEPPSDGNDQEIDPTITRVQRADGVQPNAPESTPRSTLENAVDEALQTEFKPSVRGPGNLIFEKYGIQKNEANGRVVAALLLQSLDKGDDLLTIARKCTLLHNFPAEVGGGAFAGAMTGAPQIRQKILERLLKEIDEYGDNPSQESSEGDNAFDYLYSRAMPSDFWPSNFQKDESGQNIFLRRTGLSEMPNTEKEALNTALCSILSAKVQKAIKAALAANIRPGTRDGNDILEEHGVDRTNPTDGRFVTDSLRESLIKKDDLLTIARKCTLLHDFPDEVGGGGFKGMNEVPEIKKLIITRLLDEIDALGDSPLNDEQDWKDPSFKYLYSRTMPSHFRPYDFLKSGRTIFLHRTGLDEVPSDPKEAAKIAMRKVLEEI